MPLLFCLFLSAMAASLWFNRLPENIQETLGNIRARMDEPAPMQAQSRGGSLLFCICEEGWSGGCGLAGRNDALQPGSPMSGVIGCRIFYGCSAFCAHC